MIILTKTVIMDVITKKTFKNDIHHNTYIILILYCIH